MTFDRFDPRPPNTNRFATVGAPHPLPRPFKPSTMPPALLPTVVSVIRHGVAYPVFRLQPGLAPAVGTSLSTEQSRLRVTGVSLCVGLPYPFETTPATKGTFYSLTCEEF